MSPSEILSKAADLIEPEGAWCQYRYANTANGASVWWDDLNATCFCAEGAAAKIAGGIANATPALSYLFEITKRDIVCWNDAPERTQSEVVAALRKAASLAQEKESV